VMALTDRSKMARFVRAASDGVMVPERPLLLSIKAVTLVLPLLHWTPNQPHTEPPCSHPVLCNHWSPWHDL